MSEEPDPQHRRADLIPAAMRYVCPSCDHTEAEPVDLTEDQYGGHAVSVENRFVTCSACGELLDIGWSGWTWKEGDQ